MKKVLFALAVLASATAVHAEDTLKKIKDSGVITMGVRESSGLSYTIGDGKYVGYHIDVCHRVISDLEKVVGRKLETKYQPVTSANRIPLTVNGTVDLECGSTTNNVARQKDVAFAVTTYVEEVRIAVKANSGINSISHLNGKTVATTTGTTSVQTLRKHERSTGVDFKEVFGKDHADSFLLLDSGRADAFVMDGSILAKNIATSKNPADFNDMRKRMARVPLGGVLVKNSVSTAPGFRVGNVYTMAGVPMIMRAMLEAIEPELERGAVVHAVTVSTRLPEGRIAAALAHIQKDHPDLSIGSYPFYREDGFGVQLVARGRDLSGVERAAEAIEAMIRAEGDKPERIGN